MEKYISVEYVDFSFLKYKTSVDRYLQKDTRELNFQNRIIIPMLEKVLVNTDIEVVDTSILYYRGNKNSKKIDHSKFTGKKDDGRYAAPPDLLLVKNWNLDNVNNKVEYLAAIEIKSPASGEHIHGKKFEKYYLHTQREMKAHLSVNTKVILTDCCRWQFFDQDTGFKYSPPIDLINENGRWKNSPESETPEEWYQLLKKILEFLGIE